MASSAETKIYFTGLPFRVVCETLGYLDGSDRGSLAMVNKEWARLLRLFKRSEKRAFISFDLYEREKDYARKLEIALDMVIVRSLFFVL